MRVIMMGRDSLTFSASGRSLSLFRTISRHNDATSPPSTSGARRHSIIIDVYRRHLTAYASPRRKRCAFLYMVLKYRPEDVTLSLYAP